MRKSAMGMRVNHEKKSDAGELTMRKGSDGVRVHHKKERWGKSLA